MRSNDHRRVGDIIKKLMKHPKLSEKLDKLDVIEIWEELIGHALCKYITDQKIYKGILHVKLKSSVVRDELSYKKSSIILQINQRLGKVLITDIYLK